MADTIHPLTAAQIEESLETWLEIDLTFLHVDGLAAEISTLRRNEQDFLLNWIRRIATTNIEIAYQFARRATRIVMHTEQRLVEAWALHAMDSYDRVGLRLALQVIQEVERFMQLSHARASGAIFEDIRGILLNFVRGLSGRPLKLEEGDAVYTDSETLYLPAIVAKMEKQEDNFLLCKAMVAMLWAQTRFGSFRANLIDDLGAYPDPQRACQLFHLLETLRLEACLHRELPGLFREMQRLKTTLGEATLPDEWQDWARQLAQPRATVDDSLRLLSRAYAGPTPAAICYQGELRLDAIAGCLAARMAREKIRLRVKLAQLVNAPEKQPEEDASAMPTVEVTQQTDSPAELPELTLMLDDTPVSPPEDVRQLLTSIYLDWGNIPPEHLIPAGPGEYDLDVFAAQTRDPDAVWQGTYHEEGAILYPEWDFGRQHYRKNWCVMREKDVAPVFDDFTTQVKQKYSGLIKQLHRAFEAMRDENRRLRRQAHGDDIDIDALVEALADTRDGSEMDDRLFTRMHRTERNIAVIFMVDMSGSTKGWINDAERESLVLLCEALETLGDRYAIYGFSGITRKRCELYRIKQIDEPYDEAVRARISGIRPQDYTRMGFAIRHLTHLLNAVDARTKLLVTLSDGKPDDYHDGYRGPYGIEDTRKALQEAKRSGVHPFCITLDTEARGYLPHLYGAANYIVIDAAPKLPLKIADIYRRLTLS